jgi:hypothetical protein
MPATANGMRNHCKAIGCRWTRSWSTRPQQLAIQPLAVYGINEKDFAEIVEKASNASSMKGNPVELAKDELLGILQKAL